VRAYNEKSLPSSKRKTGCKNLSSVAKLVRIRTSMPAVDGKKARYKKRLHLFERIYYETGCARLKDRRRKSEKQISIILHSLRSRTKLKEAMEVKIGWNFKSSRSAIMIFQFAKSQMTTLVCLKEIMKNRDWLLIQDCYIDCLIFGDNDSLWIEEIKGVAHFKIVSRRYLEHLGHTNIVSAIIRKNVRSIETMWLTNLRIITEEKKFLKRNNG